MPPTGWLVQVLLPLYDSDGNHFAEGLFAGVRREFIDRFGGVTAYQRAPAKGLWKTSEGEVERDDVVIFEVMADELDRAWWERYRQDLERRFRQDTIVVRALSHELL